MFADSYEIESNSTNIISLGIKQLPRSCAKVYQECVEIWSESRLLQLVGVINFIRFVNQYSVGGENGIR